MWNATLTTRSENAFFEASGFDVDRRVRREREVGRLVFRPEGFGPYIPYHPILCKSSRAGDPTQMAIGVSLKLKDLRACMGLQMMG